MARRIGILTPIGIRNLKEPGVYSDGGGLYLQIGPTGAKSWLFRFMRQGKARAMGLGPLHTIGLAEARQAALACRKELLNGQDPIEQRKAARNKSVSAQPTFAACSQYYIAAHEHGWKTPNIELSGLIRSTPMWDRCSATSRSTWSMWAL
ncbi:Arm DNA-binding domain-containing protein [Bosea sp. (in: a-proteobacteria)]|uniref:Arm DNA-binding domain-containing protein n=1 Tax=Bosea sp. (in: a-proteobacteria) TaxID=1871050 RepID=UPI0031FE5904